MTDHASQLEQSPQTRPAGRSARVGAAVKQATLDMLMEKGALGLTIEGVAERAGVNRTTVYRRWGSKPRLITWAMLETMKELAPQPDTGSVREDLFSLISSIVEFLATPLARTFFQIVVSDANDDPTVSDAIEAFWNERFELSLQLLDRAVERGEISTDLDRETVIEAIFGPVYLRHIARRGDVSEAYLRNLIDRALSH